MISLTKHSHNGLPISIALPGWTGSFTPPSKMPPKHSSLAQAPKSDGWLGSKPYFLGPRELRVDPAIRTVFQGNMMIESWLPAVLPNFQLLLLAYVGGIQQIDLWRVRAQWVDIQLDSCSHRGRLCVVSSRGAPPSRGHLSWGV